MPRHIGMAFASAMALGMGALGAASAADLPVKALPLPVVVYNWTGCYGGVNGGWKGGRFHDTDSTPGGVATLPGVTVPFASDYIDLGHLNANSGAVGAQVGCRWETPSHWVFGLEGDFDWTNLNGTITETVPGTGRSVFIPGDYYYNQARWESSIRGIIGRSFDKWLIYATGGLALMDVRMEGNFIATSVIPPLGGPAVPFPGSVGGESKTLYGYTIGAGAAYAFAKSWDIGAEYRYSQYYGDDFNLGSVAAICTATACVSTPATGHKDLTTNEVLIKLNYHFGPTAVVAKY